MAKRKVKVVIDAVKADEQTLWDKIKAWFYHSESVFLAWCVSAFGVVTGVVGSFDLAPLWSTFQTGTAFTSKQLTWMGVGIAVAGIAAYIARVRGTKEVAGRLLPTAD